MPVFHVGTASLDSPELLHSGSSDQLGSTEDPENSMSIQQPQNIEGASEKDETHAEEPAFEMPPLSARASFHGRFFHSLQPSATVSTLLREAAPSEALGKSTLSEEPEVSNKEAAGSVLQPLVRRIGSRKNRETFQSRMRLPYQQSDQIQPPVNIVTQPKPSFDVDPSLGNIPSYQSGYRYNRLVGSYGNCPPPPHSGKDWINRCFSEHLNEANTHFAPSSLENRGVTLGLWRYIFLVYGIPLICIATILLLFYGVIYGIRYIRKYYLYPRKQLQGRLLLPHNYGRKFSKSRLRKGISEGWRNEGQRTGEVIWPEEQEKVSLMTDNDHCYEDDEESTIYGESLSGTENDNENRHGKLVGRVLLDGLVGSLDGATWLRRTLGSVILNKRSQREADTVQSASPNTCHPFGDFAARQQQAIHDGNGSAERYNNTMGQIGSSDSIRSASGVDMNWERGEVTLSFRRDALLRRAMRAEKGRMNGGDLGVYAGSAVSSLRGAKASHS